MKIHSIEALIFRGADLKNNQTTKQLNNSIWANRKVETKLYLLPIGPKKLFVFFPLPVLSAVSTTKSLNFPIHTLLK